MTQLIGPAWLPAHRKKIGAVGITLLAVADGTGRLPELGSAVNAKDQIAYIGSDSQDRRVVIVNAEKVLDKTSRGYLVYGFARWVPDN